MILAHFTRQYGASEYEKLYNKSLTVYDGVGDGCGDVCNGGSGGGSGEVG